MSECDFVLRPATADDADFLVDMLVEAVNWEPGRDQSREQVLAEPGIAHYVTAWPRPGEFGFIAVDRCGLPVGAVWLRFFGADDPGYGFIAPDVPELSVAVVPAWRGNGVGRALLREAARSARQRGIVRIALSVERANGAARLYASEGYVTIDSGRDSDTMVMDLR